MNYTISVKELLSCEHALNTDQLILRILKTKGAPINGFFYLSPDTKNYTWTMEADQLMGILKFEVKDIIGGGE